MTAPAADRRLLLTLFAISLVWRLAAVGAALLMDVHPVHDEWGYGNRAHGWAGIYGDLLSGRSPDPAHWETAYEDGFQPPLHPMALGAAYATGLSSGVVGRVLNALLTALATPLVFLLARRVASRGVARTAAVLHVLYPAFTFFAHSLWAEPLFILLLLAAAERALAARGAVGRRRLRLAAVAGLCAGAMCLTRTAGLAILLVLPVAFAGPRRLWPERGPAAALMLAVSLAVLAPWQAALHREEGRPILLATSSGYNLAMGNNPFIGAACGSTWTDMTANRQLREDLDRYAEAHDLDSRHAGAAYALDQVRADPAEAVRRAGDRLRLVWSADLFPVRQVLQAVCRPLPNGLAGLHWAVHVLCYLAMMGLVLRGLFADCGLRGAGFLLALVAAGLIGPAATVGFPRLHLPLLALLLPAAGAAWQRRRDPVPVGRRCLLALTMGLVAWLVTSSLRPVIAHQLSPSVWYRPLVTFVAGAFGADATFADQVLVAVDAEGPDTLDIVPNPDRETVARVGDEAAVTVHVYGRDPGERSRLVLRPRPGVTDVVVDPVSGAHAWRWRDLAEVGLPGVRIRWQGGVPATPFRAPPETAGMLCSPSASGSSVGDRRTGSRDD